jgi:hypothetical protein
MIKMNQAGLQDSVSRMNTNSQTRALVANLDFASREAIAHGSVVSLCASAQYVAIALTVAGSRIREGLACS